MASGQEQHLHESSLDATEAALDHITNQSARKHELDPKTTLHLPSDALHAQSWVSNWISPLALEALESSAVRFHLGNYVKDRTTGVKTFEPMSIYVRLGMHLLYYGSQQQKILQWERTEQLLRDQSIKMGRAYDSPKSISHILPFIESFQLHESLHELLEPDPAKYKTFNDFFAREIRPDARPIDCPHDDRVSSSPADCRLMAYQTMDLARTFWIKGFGFSLETLLCDRELARYFDGGSMVIARLAPQDYHRWHAPVSGIVRSVKEIPGDYYTVNPQAINQAGTLDVFCENRRSVMVLDRTFDSKSSDSSYNPTTSALSTTQHKNGFSPIAIVAVGAMLVGSVKYVPGISHPGTPVKRGQCLGYFQYGGSTVLVLYPKGGLIVDADLAKTSTTEVCETMMKVGWRVGRTPE